MSIQTMIDELHSVSEELIALLDMETDRLRETDPRQLPRAAQEKNALSMRYEQIMSNLMAHGEELKKIDDDTRLALRDTQARFKCAARRNKSALKARMTVSKRLVNTIVKALKDEQQVQSGVYNRHGTIGRSPVKGYAGISQAPRISVTVDRKL